MKQTDQMHVVLYDLWGLNLLSEERGHLGHVSILRGDTETKTSHESHCVTSEPQKYTTFFYMIYLLCVFRSSTVFLQRDTHQASEENVVDVFIFTSSLCRRSVETKEHLVFISLFKCSFPSRLGKLCRALVSLVVFPHFFMLVERRPFFWFHPTCSR